jgi:hypothetical protein
MLRLGEMAMQQSGKGAASGSGPNPALSDEQAEQFASSFTPAWDSGEADGDDGPDVAPPYDEALGANATLVDGIPASAIAAAVAAVDAAAAAKAAAAPAPAPAPAPAAKFNPNATLIGTAPQANLPSALANVAAAPPPPAPQMQPQVQPNQPQGNAQMMRTQLMEHAPTHPGQAHTSGGQGANATSIQGSAQGHGSSQAKPSSGEGRWQEKVPSRPPPGPPAAMRNAPPGRVTADPFRAGKSASASDEHLVVPKKSSKTMFFVLGGLAVAAGLGLFLKFALSDDAPKALPTEMATGPAATTADIPPPPPKVDTPPPAPSPAMTTVATTAHAADPTPPTPLALPPTRTADPPAARNTPLATAPQPVPQQPRQQPRTVSAPPLGATPPPTTAPKTAPKGPNGGIVRDNPF